MRGKNHRENPPEHYSKLNISRAAAAAVPFLAGAFFAARQFSLKQNGCRFLGRILVVVKILGKDFKLQMHTEIYMAGVHIVYCVIYAMHV